MKKGIDSIIKEIEKRFSLKIESYKYKKVEFGNPALELERPGEMVCEVITPGYKILAKVKDDGKKLYHSTLDGKFIRENPNITDF